MVLGGDFNTVRCVEEKMGAVYNKSAMAQFSNFIEECGLLDLPMSGGKFTWSNNRLETTYCRLDRFLISPGFLCEFPKVTQKVLPRSLSDHNAILLADEGVNWGPKPFKFFNYWMEVKGFKEMLQTTWANIQENRTDANNIWDKFKKMKAIIKEWHQMIGARDSLKINQLEEEIEGLEKRLQVNT